MKKITKAEFKFLCEHTIRDISYGSDGTFHKVVKEEYIEDEKAMDRARAILRKIEIHLTN